MMQKKDIEKAIKNRTEVAFLPRSGSAVKVVITGEGKTRPTWGRSGIKDGWIVEPVSTEDRKGIAYLEDNQKEIVAESRQIAGTWTEYTAQQKADRERRQNIAARDEKIRQSKESDQVVIHRILDLAGVKYDKYGFSPSYGHRLDNPEMLNILRKVIKATENRTIRDAHIENIDRQARS